jgi:hypothetical protein
MIVSSSVGAASAATARGTSASVFGCAGAFCATTTFGAKWTVQSYYAEGSYTWEFTNFWLWATVGGGMNCHDPECDVWVYSADVTFYNSAGAQVASFSNPPENVYCGYLSSSNVGDRTFGRCKSVFYAPYSATKLKIHWNISVINGAGWTWPNAWHAGPTAFIAIP